MRGDPIFEMKMNVIFLVLTCALIEVQGEVYMDQTPLSMSVKAGTRISLPCEVKNVPTESIYWFGPGNEMLYSGETRQTSDKRFQLKKMWGNLWSLHIDNIKHSDNGVYECKVFTPPLTKRITLRVQVSPKILEASSSGNMQVVEGENVNLTCNAKGLPEPNIMWHFFTEGNNFKQKILSNDKSLLIKNISRDQAGSYECTAYSEVEPSDMLRMKVTVEYAPVINVTSKEQFQSKGKEAVLECTVTGYPRETFYWQKGRLKIEDNWKYKLQEITRDDFTVIMNLNVKSLEPPNDYGTYTCVAANRLGTSEGNIQLTELTTSTVTTTVTTTTASTTTPAPTTTSTTQTTDNNVSKTVISTTTETTTVQSTSTSTMTSVTSPDLPTTTTETKGVVVPPDPSSPGYEIHTNDQGANGGTKLDSFSVTLLFSVMVLMVFL